MQSNLGEIKDEIRQKKNSDKIPDCRVDSVAKLSLLHSLIYTSNYN